MRRQETELWELPQSQGTMQLQGEPQLHRAHLIHQLHQSKRRVLSNWSLSLGPLEPAPNAPHDLGILGEVAAPTQDLPYTIANNARAPGLDMPYQDQVMTTEQQLDRPVPGITKDQLAKLESEGLAHLKLKAFPSEEEAYERVKSANILTNERVIKLYHLLADGIITNTFFEPVLAWKCTLKRPWEQDTVGERDTLGTQQHASLLYVKVPAN
ncbi:hypothetical protein N7467_006592 [Penicillium canescens]|nr:hypothetical protein N7467_006592 [Penicillium canescens]